MDFRRYVASRDEDALLDMILKGSRHTIKYRSKEGKKKFREALIQGATVVVYEEEKLVGFVRAIEDSGLQLLVVDLYVKKNYRGQGLGEKLLYALHSLQKNVPILVLPKEPLYCEGLGFRKKNGLYVVPMPKKSPWVDLHEEDLDQAFKKPRRKKKKKKYHAEEGFQDNGQEFGQDEDHYMIMGFTSGGVPYGVTWEEASRDGLLEEEEEAPGQETSSGPWDEELPF